MMKTSLRAALLSITCAAVAVASAEAQSWRTVTMSQQKGDRTAVDVKVSYGAGRLSVEPIEGDLLYEMELRYDEEHFRPLAELDGSRLHLGIEGTGRNFNLGNDTEDAEMRLSLGEGISMDLELEFGAVRADVDLGGLSLTGLELATGASDSRVDISEPNPVRMSRAELSAGVADFTATRLGNLNADVIAVSTGVGKTTLDLTGRWQRDGNVTVDMGLGVLELRLPADIGIRLDKDTFLASFDDDGFTEQDGVYYSDNYDGASRRIRIEVDASFGSIDVVWVR